MAGPRPVLVLALFVSALGRVAAQGTFPDFSNEGGPPFVEGPVFEMDPEEDPATTVLAIGFVVNGTYTLSTNGPGGVVTLIGRYTSWECGPIPGSYLAAVEATIIQSDGTSTSKVMCEYGLVDTSLGTNTMSTAEGSCPTTLDTAIVFRYFPNYPEAPNTCSSDSAPVPAPADPSGDVGEPAPEPAPSEELVVAAPSPSEEQVDMASPPAVTAASPPTLAPAGTPAPERAGAPAPAEGDLAVQGSEGAAGNSEQLSQCLQECLDSKDFKPVCVEAKEDPEMPKRVLPNKCSVQCLEDFEGQEYGSDKADLPDKKYCKENAQAIYVDQSLEQEQCTSC